LSFYTSYWSYSFSIRKSTLFFLHKYAIYLANTDHRFLSPVCFIHDQFCSKAHLLLTEKSSNFYNTLIKCINKEVCSHHNTTIDAIRWILIEIKNRSWFLFEQLSDCYSCNDRLSFHKNKFLFTNISNVIEQSLSNKIFVI